jgi:hypothetical protein
LLFSYANASFEILSFDFFEYSRSDCEIPRNDDDWEGWGVFLAVFEKEGRFDAASFSCFDSSSRSSFSRVVRPSSWLLESLPGGLL